jgi:hypothetical protein
MVLRECSTGKLRDDGGARGQTLTPHRIESSHAVGVRSDQAKASMPANIGIAMDQATISVVCTSAIVDFAAFQVWILVEDRDEPG